VPQPMSVLDGASRSPDLALAPLSSSARLLLQRSPPPVFFVRRPLGLALTTMLVGNVGDAHRRIVVLCAARPRRGTIGVDAEFAFRC